MNETPKALHTCKKAAVFSDIHSNYHALLACYEDAQKEGADCYVFLGDYVSGLAKPRETLDLTYEIQKKHPTVCIRGNRERYMLDHHCGQEILLQGSYTGSYFFTYERLQDKDLKFFADLPIFDTVVIGGVAFEIAHATQEQDRNYFEKGDARIAEVFDKMQTKYLLTGHSHKQYIQQEQGKTIINPGAVGLPKEEAKAQYALVEINNGEVSCTMRRVAYEMDAMIRAQFQSGLVACAKSWAISDLYSALTGEEYTKLLLTKMFRCAEKDKSVLYDESIWHKFAAELGLRFTENEILQFAEKSKAVAPSMPM